MELLTFLPLIIIMGAFLYFTSRRQRRIMQATIDLHESLQVGERVYTTSGLQATIAAIGEDTFDLEIAPGVVTRWMKMAIRDRVPAQTDDAGDEGAFGALDEASPANPLRIETDADRLAKD